MKRAIPMVVLTAVLVGLPVFAFDAAGAVKEAEPHFQVAPFTADVTIPVGHRCMGILPVKAKTIRDSLEARGFVLLGPGKPVVLVAFDWCEIRNGAYDRWRETLAEAAGTTRERVLVCSVHQHDAPVVDSGAQKLLDEVGLEQELYDPEFHAHCLRKVRAAMKKSLKTPRRVTHIGLGQAKVKKIASNRRVEHPDGQVDFSRYSASGGDPFDAEAPEGLIDPWLKTLSFWDGETPVLALSAYATHPMSYYGRGGVSADFVGAARRRRQRDDPDVTQVYISGCSGDVTAGKYNDGSDEMRRVLADRLYRAMKRAWQNTRRKPLNELRFRNTELDIPYRKDEEFSRETLNATLHDKQAKMRARILAAMGLSSRKRVERGQSIDMPCLDFGSAQVVLFPGESFVAYQLAAQRMRPDSFVLCIGYGECWPGYIPTQSAFEDGFDHGWRWAGRGGEKRIRAALQRLLQPGR